VYPGVVYGPGPAGEGNLVGRLLSDYLAGRLPGLIGAEHRWSCSYIDDVAAGHCAALELGAIGGRYALGGENTTPYRIFEIVAGLTGGRRPRRIPPPIARAVAYAEELRVVLFGGVPLVTRGAIDIFDHDWPLDSGPAVRELGYSITPIEEGLERTLAFLRGEGSRNVGSVS
jgi:nucleoside-diphosphate-sugar epimerase